jgi:hypothetical protein
MEFVRRTSDRLDGEVVLAPFEMVAVMGLMNSSVRFEATRPTYMRYGLAGRGDAEITRRIAAQAYVTRCRPRAAGATALLRSIELGVSAIVARSCDPGIHPVVAELEARMPGSWMVAETAAGYTLLVNVDAESARGGNPREQ